MGRGGGHCSGGHGGGGGSPRGDGTVPPQPESRCSATRVVVRYLDSDCRIQEDLAFGLEPTVVESWYAVAAHLMAVAAVWLSVTVVPTLMVSAMLPKL